MPTRSAVVARAAGLSAVLLAGASLVGCNAAQSTNSSCATTRVIGAAHGRTGPSLVAGDALAIQTRLAGGYDMPRMPDERSRYAVVLE
ncbi:MAG: hypothetical protein RIB32_00310 [Phycisphaerales bacterium]